MLALLFAALAPGLAQETAEHHHHDMAGMAALYPPDDQAFSEFSHHLAGGFVILIGLGELTRALRSARQWRHLQWLLTVGLLGAGGYLLVWSDIDVWSLRDVFVQPFLVGDMETLQHKFYAVCLLAVGVIEWLRRRGRLTHPAWEWPLPLFAILGGVMLFAHMHSVLTDVRVIQMHHRLMGAAAILAGACKLAPAVMPRLGTDGRRTSWDTAWAILIVLIGAELLLYFE